MAYTNVDKETEYLGNRQYRHAIHLRPVASSLNGGLVSIDSNFQDSGIPARPHIVTAAPFYCSVGRGLRRIHPTREAHVYMEIRRAA